MIVTGRVIAGEGKAGGYYGLPTANLSVSPTDLEPGVYTGFATLKDERYPSVICWGEKFEAHLFGYTGDLHDQELTIEIGEKVSDLVPFVGEDQMRAKILNDVAHAKVILGIA